MFRADASVQIGTGHVMRCLTLAEELASQGHECRFICRDHHGHLGSLVRNKGFALHLLTDQPNSVDQPDEVEESAHAYWLGGSWQQDAQQTVEILSESDVDWMIVDHYALDARWEREISSQVRHILVIDDLADREHICSLLLDQNLGRSTDDYDALVPNDAPRLIGPHYALLRPEFRQWREKSLKRRQTPQLKRILISLGGVDRANVTTQVLSTLAQTSLPRPTELDIIMGASAPELPEVRAQAESLPFQAIVSVNVSDMAERMYRADVSIGAAGSTSWERCCLGLPAVVIILADNQVSGANALEAVGAAFTIPDRESVHAALPPALVQTCKSDVLRRMSNAAGKIADGEGASRVVESMLNIAGDRQ